MSGGGLGVRGFGLQFLLLRAGPVEDARGRVACVLHDRFGVGVGAGAGADLVGFGLGVGSGLLGLLAGAVQDFPQPFRQSGWAVGDLAA